MRKFLYEKIFPAVNGLSLMCAVPDILMESVVNPLPVAESEGTLGMELIALLRENNRKPNVT